MRNGHGDERKGQMMAKKKPSVKGGKESKNKDPQGRERNYKFVVEYDEPVKPKKDKQNA